MDDLELLRTLHLDVLPPTETQRARARDRLLAAARSRERPRGATPPEPPLGHDGRPVAPWSPWRGDGTGNGRRPPGAPLLVTAVLALVVASIGWQVALRDPSPRPTIDAGVLDTPEPAGPLALRVERDVDITGDPGRTARGARMTVFVPDRAGPWPLVVLLPGWVPTDAVEDMAVAIAERGAVVHLVGSQYADGDALTPQVLRDMTATAACAVRSARATAAEHDAIAGQLVLVGHDLGAWVGALVALMDTGDLPAGPCLVSEGSTVPTAFVGVAGHYGCFVFTSGCPTLLTEQAPELLPAHHADRRPDVPVHLLAPSHSITGSPDVEQELGELLRAPGRHVAVTVVDDASPGEFRIAGRPAHRTAVDRIVTVARVTTARPAG